MHVLKPVIRDYAWGSPTLLADLQGREPTGRPEAELWLGDHPGAPCVAVVADGAHIGLDEVVAADPERCLGPAAPEGRLPFLMKLLAAGAPLSIQAHPTLEQARAGFAAEEAAGVPVDAPERNYKDANHKPEMLLALTPFSAMCGFRSPEVSSDSFEALARALTERADGDTSAVAIAAARISQALAAGDLEDAFTSILDPDSVWGAPGAVAQVVDVLRAAPDLAERDPSLATALEAAQHHPDDPGVVVAILLNRVDLAPGQAIHLPAGNVHAYLHGLGVEVMAASDNVLRGGLTPKHVDVPELRRVVTFEALPVPSTEPERVADSVVAFRPPFEEFELLQATLEDDAVHGLDVHGPGIAVVTRGTASLALAGQEIELGPGEAVFLPAAETASGPLAVRAAAGAPATVHVAGLPRG
ncbi:mannose-6-phosphate isomerase, class I [Micrococcus luteus]|uniref:mannose-6-phosphate isomerase, class I n=1 Tax=Micrococcus luteus TaxID=1270 RepID=UPI0012DFB762|nr:mannose-6-phosphate isomerase, class I [Micrococcus luteus]MCV7549361.1 mannose-6-phosphate isomerase, class I [Micrococcus luteus]MCV7670846.1 mannose-6-phosphate isomerase, class I [Micrococcus luteus]QGS21835.1 mannose-6-phosphate isomerase, class I [Micrococcus luteus]QHG59279.1 mannose-6-phosphate isomerase, class I [Micrococcus luteus]